MNPFKSQDILQTILKQRNFSYGISLCVGISNLLLVVYLMSRDEKTILIPQFDTDNKFSLTTTDFSVPYLIQWADATVQKVYTVNPESVEKRVRDTLNIAYKNHGTIEKDMKKWISFIKKEHFSTVFYPKDFDVFKTKGEVHVSGQLLSYFGTEKAPLVQEKKFLVSFERGPRGVIFLTGLKEMTND